MLDVGWTNTATNRTYATYNLTLADLVDPVPPAGSAASEHAIGLFLGQGFCSGYAGLLQMHIHAADNDAMVLQTVATTAATGAWSMSQGPITADSTYYGETYEAALEQPGWATANFTPPPTTRWHPAAAAPGAGGVFMASQLMPAIKRVHEIAAANVSQIAPGVFVYDFGQEFAGWARLTLPAGVPAGTNVTLYFAEALSHPPLGPANGSVYMGNLFWSYPVDHYVSARLSGRPGDNDALVYEPRFTYHGFRYVQVQATPALNVTLTLDSLVGINARTAAQEAADIGLSEPLLQRLSDNSWWTEAAALMSIPAGCAGARGRGRQGGVRAAMGNTQPFHVSIFAGVVRVIFHPPPPSPLKRARRAKRLDGRRRLCGRKRDI